MRILKLYTIVTFMAAALGCTKGTPNFSTLGADNIPQPTFNGATEKYLTATSPSETFSISGDCDSKVRDIAGTAVGTATAFATLTSMATSGVTVNCSTTGKFAFTLKSLSDLGYTPVNGTVYDIELRSVTAVEIPIPASFTLPIRRAGAPTPTVFESPRVEPRVSSAERVATGGNFKAQIRITNQTLDSSDLTVQDAMTTKSGGDFKMHSGLAADGD